MEIGKGVVVLKNECVIVQEVNCVENSEEMIDWMSVKEMEEILEENYCA